MRILYTVMTLAWLGGVFVFGFQYRSEGTDRLIQSDAECRMQNADADAAGRPYKRAAHDLELKSEARSGSAIHPPDR